MSLITNNNGRIILPIETNESTVFLL
jgi:hypothetical protein